MIEDENHPAMQAAIAELVPAVEALWSRHTISNQFVRALRTLLYDHRVKWRNRDVDFPKLVPLLIPRFRVCDLVRADLELPSIRIQAVNLATKYPRATPEELYSALKYAFPDLKPGDLVDEALVQGPAHRKFLN